LGLPQPADIGSDQPIAAHIALLTEVAKQPHGGVTPRIPALEEIGFIEVKDTIPEVAPEWVRDYTRYNHEGTKISQRGISRKVIPLANS